MDKADALCHLSQLTMATPFRTRRTIKPAMMDPSRDVPHSLLLELLEDAHWAPSHGLNQPWRFHVFTGAGREKLGASLMQLYDAVTPENLRREEKRIKLGTQTSIAPVCIAVLAHLPPNNRISEMDEIAATACAVQNLLLSAHLHGLGSFWSSPAAACCDRFVEWLELSPQSFRCLGIVFLGYLKDNCQPAQPSRCPLMERVVFHQS